MTSAVINSLQGKKWYMWVEKSLLEDKWVLTYTINTLLWTKILEQKTFLKISGSIEDYNKLYFCPPLRNNDPQSLRPGRESINPQQYWSQLLEPEHRLWQGFMALGTQNIQSSYCSLLRIPIHSPMKKRRGNWACLAWSTKGSRDTSLWPSNIRRELINRRRYVCLWGCIVIGQGEWL